MMLMTRTRFCGEIPAESLNGLASREIQDHSKAWRAKTCWMFSPFDFPEQMWARIRPIDDTKCEING